MKQTKLYTNTVSPLLLESFYKISKMPNVELTNLNINYVNKEAVRRVLKV